MTRVLVIDDNPDNLELMTYLLRAAGHQTVRAMDGAGGLDAAAGQDVDLIVCDAHLPGMDGPDVVRRLKADPVLRRIPVLVATASRGDGDRARLLAAGFDDYIAKPIAPAEFVRQIERFLPAKA